MPKIRGKSRASASARKSPYIQTREKGEASEPILIPCPQSLFENSGILQAELQNTRCTAAKYKSYHLPQCFACIRRQAGDTCRFSNIRHFMRNEGGTIASMLFNGMQCPDAPDMSWRKEWNVVLSEDDLATTKRKLAKALLPTLRNELDHLHLQGIIHRQREREVRATCDTCMTSLFSSSWFCRSCGRETCAECFARIHELTSLPSEIDGSVIDTTTDQHQRSRGHGRRDAFLLRCSRSVNHGGRDFSPMSRLDEEELVLAIREMEEIVLKEDKKIEDVIPIANRDEGSFAHAQDSSAYDANLPDLRFSDCSTEYTSANPFVPNNLPNISISTPSLPIRRFTNAALTQEIFPLVWALGEPLIVTDLLERFKISWTPEYFIEQYGTQNCVIVECQTQDTKRTTVGEFFREFGRYEQRNGHWKLKDWPPSADFKEAFPELYEDFNNAAPVPNYVRRDGVLNIASHFPSNTVSPDIGPKMYNAFATTLTTRSKGSTRLHMDMADAVNIMTFAAPMPDGGPGCAAWDIFRAEDSNKLRAWLSQHYCNGEATVMEAVVDSASVGVQRQEDCGHEQAQVLSSEDTTWRSGSSGSTTPSDGVSEKSKPLVPPAIHDPIHEQQFYITEEMRAALYRDTGVKSFRFYQRPGEAVFIPAGCAHQVANLSDCIKVAADFVSHENVERCEKLTREFRDQNQKVVWKEDVLQLKTMMWFAWLSCRHVEAERDRQKSEVTVVETPAAETETGKINGEM